MHNFAATYRQFPGHANLKHGVSTNYRKASVVVQPFSWRVAMLPFIVEEELYNHYRFDEPWDSEHDRQLIDKMPALFRSPFAPELQPAGHTNIQGFATKRGLMEPANGSSFASVSDGLSNTILAIETAESVPWTKPVDLKTTKVKLIEKHPLLVLIADGSVDVIAQPIDQDKLDKMITRDGGEVVPQ